MRLSCDDRQWCFASKKWALVGACRVAVNVASLIADSGAITGRVRTRSQCETRKKKKKKEEIGAEAGYTPIKEEESLLLLVLVFCSISVVIIAACKHGRTEIVLCPQRKNESAPRAENVRKLIVPAGWRDTGRFR